MAAIRNAKKKKQSISNTCFNRKEVSPIGLDEQLARLNEAIIWPFIYPSLFKKMGIKPARGVLFYGPPGTGKTMMARFLIEHCNKMLSSEKTNKKVSFFVKNGSECLSKWIGEAEKSLRVLFEEARKKEPSIIFFDEIDGLAPKRTDKTEQSHISIVSCLLSLMDGLQDCGRIVVIGATNRLDALDNAFRRPGRFDKELLFELPSHETRRKMFMENTSTWPECIAPTLLHRLVVSTSGFSGSDLKALCDGAAIVALKREMESGVCIKESVSVCEKDFQTAFSQGSFCRGKRTKPFLFEKSNTSEVEKYVFCIFSIFYKEHAVVKAYQPRFLFCSRTGSSLRNFVYQIASKIHEEKGFHTQWLSFGLDKKELDVFLQTLDEKQPSFVVIEEIESFSEKEPETLDRIALFFEKKSLDYGVGIIATAGPETLNTSVRSLMKMEEAEQLDICKIFWVEEKSRIDTKSLHERIHCLYKTSRDSGQLRTFFEDEGDEVFVARIVQKLKTFLLTLDDKERSVFLSRRLPSIFSFKQENSQLEKNLSLLLNENPCNSLSEGGSSEDFPIFQ